jgi:DNA (cytosine-5)-methyltransferase 1
VITYGSVCSGIEAASVAWHPLGWKAEWLAEIETFPCAVLAHHYPNVPNYGDMTALPEMVTNGNIAAPDVLVGGTPCQAFSVAGLRKSLEDNRGQLTIKFLELINANDNVRSDRGQQPCIVIWENVPGVLSTKDNAFGCFLAGLAGEDEALQPPGGKWSNAGCVFGPQRAVAWRVFDAQYFGVAQRRRRVFVVASARDGFDPAAVLFEFDGVRRDTAPSREAGQSTAHDVAPSLVSSGRGVKRIGETPGFTLQAAHSHAVSIGWSEELTASVELHGTIQRGGDGGRHEGVMTPLMQVRRLTPTECERLQGFPDSYTNVPHRGKPAADGPRYKALGNSMAVPVMRWIGSRINEELQ